MNLQEQLLERVRYRQRIENGLMEAEMILCKKDIVHWVNQWTWGYDPRQEVKHIPFVLWPVQERLLHWLDERKTKGQGGLVEKGRDKGATYLCVLHALHSWFFVPGSAIGFGSRKFEQVDRKGDPKCIFEKIRDVLYSLPQWMLPQGFDRDHHDNLARLINPANGSSITGEGGDNVGRGGRTSLYFVDEAAFLEHPKLIDAALHRNTNVRIDISTPNGPGNPFARKRFSLPPEQVFTLHYRDDPRETPESIAKRKAETDPVIWAQEEEIDYSASLEGICIPAIWVRAAIDLLHPVHHRSGPVLAGLDISEFGEDETVFIPRQGPIVLEIVNWHGKNTTDSAWIARDHVERLKVEECAYDTVGVGAGVRGTWLSSEVPLMFAATAVNTGEKPSDRVWPSGKTSKDMFFNQRAELWWLLRCRFERAYEWKNGKKEHPIPDLISLPSTLPNLGQLIAELSQPLIERTDRGKIKLESKRAMKQRGLKSPNFADGLVLAFFASGDTYKLLGRIPKSLSDSYIKETFHEGAELPFEEQLQKMGW